LRIMSRLRGGGGRLGRYGYRLVNGGPFAFATGPTGVPTRTAGITPAPALDTPHHGASRPALQPAE
jgi:cytochrome d ubiquinol oxidase subunit I